MVASDWLKYLPGAGAIGAGAYGLFGHQKNPADVANQYIGKIPGQTEQYYKPWMEAGQRQLHPLEEQYGQLMQNPGGKFNEIGQNFHESPGFKFALQQILQANANKENAMGMGGSPEQTQQDMTLANNLANQDYYNYMHGATGLYGQGLQGSQNLAGMGQQAGSNFADMIASALAQQGSNAAIGQMQQNQNKAGGIGNILGGLSSFLF